VDGGRADETEGEDVRRILDTRQRELFISLEVIKDVVVLLLPVMQGDLWSDHGQ